MSISFNCPKCRKSFKVGDDLAGRPCKCPSCGSQFKIPPRRAAAAPTMPSLPDNPFGAFDPADSSNEGESYQPRRRRQRGFFSSLMGCMFLLLFLLIAAVGGAYAAVYFHLVKADPILARVPFKIPGLAGNEPAPTGDPGKEQPPHEANPKEGDTLAKKENPADPTNDYRFLPDKTALLINVNVEAVLSSKLHEKFKTPTFGPDADKKLDEIMKAALGVPLSGIGRLLMGARTKEDAITVVRTKPAITADEIKKNIKAEWTESKAGKYVMYDSPTTHFSVVDEHTLVVGENSDTLKKVLERDKPPEMIGDLQPFFKQVVETKTLALAFGAQELRLELDKHSPDIAAFKPSPDFQPLVDSQAFLVQIELTAGMEASASLQCKDAAGAELLKKSVKEAAGRGQGYFEQMAKANAGKPPEAMAKSAIQALGSIQLAVNGDSLAATLALPDDAGANLLMLGFSLLRPTEPPKK